MTVLTHLYGSRGITETRLKTSCSG